MFGIGLPELIIIFFIFAVLIVPVVFISRILNKAGFSPWLALIAIVPLFNLIFLWVFAFIDWPNLDPKKEGVR